MKKILTVLGLLAISSMAAAQANDLFRANALFTTILPLLFLNILTGHSSLPKQLKPTA